MQNNLNFKTFISVTPNKFILTVTNLKNEILFEKVYKESHIDETKEINYRALGDFLKNNIIEIEKRLKKFIETVHLIIDYKNIYSVNFSIKNKVDIISLDTKIVNELLVDAKNYCKDTLKNADILHLKIDRFYIDNNYYDVFPDKKKCKNLSIDLSFICLPNYVLKNIKKLLSEYKISVDKAFSYPYLKSFSNDKSKNIYEVAQKVLSGHNVNEVLITNKSSRNKGFFEKFFEFFK